MKEDRQKVWEDYLKQGGYDHKIVRHMFTQYNRYHEADYILKWFINNNVKLDFPILDFGSGTGDYGIYLLRAGASKVDMYDFPRSTQLIKYRLKIEDIKGGKAIDADKIKPKFKNYDFIIFGEVLEHLSDPFELLEKVVNNGTKYIFTSSYPYRSDDPDDPYWDNHDHDEKARLQMVPCRKILEDNYDYTKFEGELRLWVRK